MKVGVLSDLHLDFNVVILEHGVDLLEEIALENELDVLLLAGDSTESFELTNKISIILTNRGIDTYFIMGNHEHWSITYDEAQEYPTDRYINNKSLHFGDKHIIAIDGTFDYSYVDKPKDVLNKHGRKFFDLHYIKTKDFDYLDKVNKDNLKSLINEATDDTVLMMHYMPSVEFAIKKDYIWNMNNAFMGSDYESIIGDKVSKVIFGHTHIPQHKVINGVEYICKPVGYKNYEFYCNLKEQMSRALTII